MEKSRGAMSSLLSSLSTHFCMTTHSDFSALKLTRVTQFRRGALLAVTSLLSVALLGCGHGNAKTSSNAPRVVRVVEVSVSNSRIRQATRYTGVVRARTESNLGFRVAGKVAERLVNAGDVVKKDQPLLKLDRIDYELALRSARAAVEAARAANTQASLEAERVRTLVEKRAESRDALERATAAADSSAARLRAAEAQADQITNQASYTVLSADSDGVVMSTLAEPGQVVAAGQPVIVLAKDGPREAAVDIPEGSLSDIRERSATAQLYGQNGAPIPATLREISGAADPVSRTYQARYVLDGDPTGFPLGSTVTVQVTQPGEVARPTVEIPLTSLIDRGDGAAVWVVDPKTSTVQKRSVSIAKLGAETASIRQGLQPGDVVVALGAQLLNSGLLVRTENSSAKGAR